MHCKRKRKRKRGEEPGEKAHVRVWSNRGKKTTNHTHAMGQTGPCDPTHQLVPKPSPTWRGSALRAQQRSLGAHLPEGRPLIGRGVCLVRKSVRPSSCVRRPQTPQNRGNQKQERNRRNQTPCRPASDKGLRRREPSSSVKFRKSPQNSRGQ